MEKVSIIIPVYNVDDYLPSDAVECLLDKAVLHSMDLVVANFYKEENGVVTPIPSFFHEEGVLEREEFQKLIIDNTGDSLCGKLISKTMSLFYECNIRRGSSYYVAAL